MIWVAMNALATSSPLAPLANGLPPPELRAGRSAVGGDADWLRPEGAVLGLTGGGATTAGADDGKEGKGEALVTSRCTVLLLTETPATESAWRIASSV